MSANRRVLKHIRRVVGAAKSVVFTDGKRTWTEDGVHLRHFRESDLDGRTFTPVENNPDIYWVGPAAGLEGGEPSDVYWARRPSPTGERDEYGLIALTDRARHSVKTRDSKLTPLAHLVARLQAAAGRETPQAAVPVVFAIVDASPDVDETVGDGGSESSTVIKIPDDHLVWSAVEIVEIVDIWGLTTVKIMAFGHYAKRNKERVVELVNWMFAVRDAEARGATPPPRPPRPTEPAPRASAAARRTRASSDSSASADEGAPSDASASADEGAPSFEVGDVVYARASTFGEAWAQEAEAGRQPRAFCGHIVGPQDGRWVVAWDDYDEPLPHDESELFFEEPV